MKANSQRPTIIAVAALNRAASTRRLWQAARSAGSACLFLMAAAALPAQLFQQDFSASGTLSDYISASSPTAGQWNAISTSGAGTTVGIVGNALQFVRTSNLGSFSRTTDFSGPPTSMICKFDLTVSGNSVATTTAAVWQMGTNFGTANSAEAIALVHSRFGLNISATAGQFSLRNIENGTNSSTFSGTQTITWVINNSGGTLTYLAPDGSQETVADDTADVWAGTAKAIDNLPATGGTIALTDWKFAFTVGTATITMDNFRIDLVSAAPRPIVVFGPAVTNGVFVVRYSSLANASFTIESTTSVSPVAWGKLTNVNSLANGEFELVTPVGNNPSRFFRAVYPSY